MTMTGRHSVDVTFSFQGWEKQSDRLTKACQSNCVFQPLKIPGRCGGWRNFVSGAKVFSIDRGRETWPENQWTGSASNPLRFPGPDISAPLPRFSYWLVSSWTYFTLIALCSCFKSPLNESQACLLRPRVECSLLFCFVCLLWRCAVHVIWQQQQQQQHEWVFS